MKFWTKIAAQFRKKKFDGDMAEEMRLHLERRTEENIANGMSPENARYAALRTFGGADQVKESARDQRGFAWLEQVVQDVRYALRQFARAKGFTAVVVLTLALGIGSITAIYSVVDAVFFHPIPGEYPERLVQIGQWIQFGNMPAPSREAGLSTPPLEALQANRDFFANLTWCDSFALERKGDDFATTVSGAKTPPDFFAFFGVRPLLGRTFLADEAVAIEQQVPVKGTSIVLSYAWWKSEFGGDPQVLGRTIEMSDRRFTVVGVMPKYFQFPTAFEQFWLPAESERPSRQSMSAPRVRLFARLKPETSIPQVQAMADAITLRLLNDYPATDRSYGDYWRRTKAGLRLWVQPLHQAIQDSTYATGVEEMRRTLFAFLAAIGFVLAIVCANVANLTLARTERRQHELSIRAALGAGRARLMRQLLTENLLLAFFGGAAGLVLATWGIRVLAAFNRLPQLRPIELDSRVLVIALIASLFTGLVFGLMPAWGAGRANETLKQSGATSTGDARSGYYRQALVILEVALSVVLLTGAGLMIQSVIKLLQVDPGYDPTNVIEVRLALYGQSAPPTVEAKNALVMRIQERLAALPGVDAVGAFGRGSKEEKFQPEGRNDPVLMMGEQTGLESSDYFRAMGIPLLRGRHFEPGDADKNARYVIVNETLARACWPGENPVGKKLRALERKGQPSYDVIGVVGDARIYRLEANVRPVFYQPSALNASGGEAEWLIVRTSVEPSSIVPAIRAALKEESSWMRMPYISLMRQAFYDRTESQRTFRNYLVTFAATGLLLAALGIYGVLAYSVVRRTREIGIRIAIGAEKRHVIGMVVGEGARLIGIGAVVGLLAAFWLTQLLEKQIFGVSPRDPIVFGAVILVLAIVAIVACWLPARRAAKVDPVVALRAE